MQLLALYDAYVDTFRVDGELPLMMALKREHTSHVVENALAIASGEGFDPVTSRVCEAAALLHDTGRYEQLRLYNTFRDSDSVDHAVFSHDIVVQKGWLSDWPEDERSAILCAVLYHNRRDLPEGLDALTLAASQTVRDADKLDIFRVMEDRVKNTDWRHDSLAFWNLPTTARPSWWTQSAMANPSTIRTSCRLPTSFLCRLAGWSRALPTPPRAVSRRSAAILPSDETSYISSPTIPPSTNYAISLCRKMRPPIGETTLLSLHNDAPVPKRQECRFPEGELFSISASRDAVE